MEQQPWLELRLEQTRLQSWLELRMGQTRLQPRLEQQPRLESRLELWLVETIPWLATASGYHFQAQLAHFVRTSVPQAPVASSPDQAGRGGQTRLSTLARSSPSAQPHRSGLRATAPVLPRAPHQVPAQRAPVRQGRQTGVPSSRNTMATTRTSPHPKSRIMRLNFLFLC